MDRALLSSLSLEHYADLALDFTTLAALVASGDRLAQQRGTLDITAVKNVLA